MQNIAYIAAMLCGELPAPRFAMCLRHILQAERAHMAETRADLDHADANRSDLERERAAMVQEDRESRFVRDRLHDWDEIAAIIAAGSDSDND